MQKIYLDIETVPSSEAWVKDAVEQKTKPPATHKKQETIDKWYSEKYDAEFSNLGCIQNKCW